MLQAKWILILTFMLFAGTLADVEKDRAKFEKMQRVILVEAGQRHLKLGLWCRDKGLTTQSAFEIVRAVEVSDGQYYPASQVLRVMRQYDQAFWKKRKAGGSALRKSYDSKATKLRKEDQEEWLDLAAWAWKRDLREESLGLYRQLLLATGEALQFDPKERLVLEFGNVPADAAAVIREEAIEINDKLYLRDEFLAALPDIGSIHEVDGGGLRVRSPAALEELEVLHRLGLALLPHLEEELQARPARRMDLFLFPTRAGYEGWLDAAGMSGHKAGSGLAEPRSFVAIVCSEGLDEDVVSALVLHELTHLFWYGSSPSVMPDWFDEGLAETYGGHGSFRWEGESLVVAEKLHERELARLRDPEALFSVTELLVGDALAELTADKERGRLFYVQSWALLRFFREGADKKLRARFETWVAMCVGSAAGAEAGKPRTRNRQPASQSFGTMFGDDMPAIEDAFYTWLETL